MSDIIESKDLFAPDLTDSAKQGFIELNKVMADTEILLTKIKQTAAGISKNPLNNSSDINRQKKELAETLTLENKINEQRKKAVQIANTAAAKQLQAEKILKKAIEDEAKAAEKQEVVALKNSSAYKQLEDQYKKAAQAAKDLAASQGLNSKETQEAIAKAKGFNDQLKAIDYSLGNAQRNVGNYSGQLGKLAKGLKGLGGLGRFVSNALGIDPEVANGIREAGLLLKEYHHTQSAVEAVTHAQTEANEGLIASEQAQTVAIEETTVAQEASNTAFLASPLGITALAAGAVVAAFGILKATEVDLTKQTEIYNEAVNKLNETFYEQKRKLIDLQTDQNEITGKYSKEQAENLRADLKGLDEKKKVYIEYQQAVSKLHTEALKLGKGQGTEQIAIKQELAVKQLENLTKQYYADLKSIDTVTSAEKTKALEEETKKIKEKDKKTLESEKKDTFDYAKELRDLEISNIKYSYERKKAEIYANYDDENKKFAGHTEILKQLEIKKTQALEELWREREVEYAKIVSKMREDDIKKVQDAAKKMKEENPDPEFNPQLKANIELAKKKKEILGKELKEEADMEIEFLQEMAKRKDDLLKQQLDNDIATRQRNIEQQQQLAIAGRSNTLAFEKAEQAKDEKRKQGLAVKEKKREKEIAFLKLFASYADKGEPDQALSKTLVQMAIAGVIAGSYIDGTENVAQDLKNNKVHNGKDGYIIAVDGDERILNPEQNKMIGNMSNDALAKLARDYNGGLIPKEMTQFGSFAQNMSESLLLHELASLNSEIKEIKQALKNRPVHQHTRNKNGDEIDTKIINGLKKQTLHKNNSPLNYV